MGGESHRGSGGTARDVVSDQAAADRVTGPLLATKHRVPPLRPALVPRTRLTDRLERGRRRPLTLIAAPAGFGKTTLVLDWLHRIAVPVAWLSLAEEESDPLRFLAYLVAAVAEVDARLGRIAGQLLRSPQPPPHQAVAVTLVNDLASAQSELVLVLDDFHALRGAEVHETVQLLVENAPPGVHIVIITREDPPLPLPRLRVRGEITEIRERDLRFTPQEAAEFLSCSMGLRLAPEAVAALADRTEGWIAGLQLAALALQERDVAAGEQFIRSFTGDDRYVIDYLMAEVLDRQPPHVRDFLTRTAILDRLCAGLCDAVLEVSGTSQAILEGLERANLFVIPLDNRREWYRYHRLFAEFLRSRLATAQAAELHRRAAVWYEEHGAAAQGVGHALAFGAASGRWEDAERLIKTVSEVQLLSGSVRALCGWLAALPRSRVAADPELATSQAWACALAGELAEAERLMAVAERALAAARPAGGGSVAGKLALLCSLLSMRRRDHQGTAAHAQRALQLIGQEEMHWRIIGLWILAEAQERTRPIEEAIASLAEVQITARAAGNPVFAASVDAQLAAALDNHGCRRRALEVCREALLWHESQIGAASPVLGLLFGRLALLHYAGDDLAEARAAAERGVALAGQVSLPDLASFTWGVLAMVQYAQEEVAASRESLRVAQGAGSQGLGESSWLPAWAAAKALQEGDLAAAQAWARNERASSEEEPGYLRMDVQLTYARLLLAEGRSAEAKAWLARLERFAVDRGLRRWLITIHVLSALAAGERSPRAAAGLVSGQSPARQDAAAEALPALVSSAREHMARAIALASAEGYLRPFLDEGPDVAALAASVRYAAPAFVDDLLAASGAAVRAPAAERPAAGGAAPAVPGLVEPLSERELEVLRLIAVGLSNAEIADRLIIALGTVKRHINNIYGKLGVASRTQAIVRARDLGLL